MSTDLALVSTASGLETTSPMFRSCLHRVETQEINGKGGSVTFLTGANDSPLAHLRVGHGMSIYEELALLGKAGMAPV